MFEIGDNVLISRVGGYPWIDSMNCMIGYRGKIVKITKEPDKSCSGFSYKVIVNHPDDIEYGNGFWYPEESLEKIEER